MELWIQGRTTMSSHASVERSMYDPMRRRMLVDLYNDSFGCHHSPTLSHPLEGLSLLSDVRVLEAAKYCSSHDRQVDLQQQQ
jgi:hypothetical protein